MAQVIQQAQQLLAHIHQSSVADIPLLRAIITEADKYYYVYDNPMLADAEYDALFTALKKLEKQHPELIIPSSPTQRVAQGLNDGFASVAHLVPMLSLENSYNSTDLLDWDKRCCEHNNGEPIQYCVEPKYDGASISLIYEHDILTRAATRGDGVMGDDITTNAKQIKSIPLAAPISQYGFESIEVRGEVLIDKQSFDAYNNKLIEKGIAALANARNAASSSLRIKNPTEVAERNLVAYLYHISFTQKLTNNNSNTLHTHYQALEALHTLGIKSSLPQAKLCNNINEVIAHVQAYEQMRDELPYEIDGMVIKVNSFALQDAIGQTSHHPRWAMAYKFKARQATSTLLDVEFQVGRTGSVTPVAKITPVAIGGVVISSISLHNADLIAEKDIKIGDTVLVERAGDVIPQIVKSLPELRNGKEQVIIFPTQCPVCQAALSRPEAEAVWRCSNYNCAAQVVERIIHFASKDAMDIRGLGDAIVKQFCNNGWLHSITDIYNLPYEQIQALDGFGSKSASKLQEAINNSKQQPLAKVIYGLGIRYVGETTSKTLARNINDITDLFTKTVNELKQLEDVGDKVASSIVEYCAGEQNRQVILQLKSLGLMRHNPSTSQQDSGSLSGKSFLFTGTLSQLKRSSAEALVEAKGGIILGGVSAKLNYLVVGADAGSKLEKAKKLGTIIILDEQQFITLAEQA
jgi:DNA ligase (NAD+)